MRRRLLSGASALLAASILASCGSAEPPQPAPDEVPEIAPPALDSARLSTILEEIGESLDAADAELDPELLGDRVIGPARETRTREYRLVEASDGEVEPTAMDTTASLAATGISEDWPRNAMVITEIPEGENLPLLLTLTQDDVHSPYALWGFTTLFPGVEYPAMARPEVGSPSVAADAGDLVATPEEVLERYAHVVADPDSEFASDFADDPYLELAVRDQVEDLQEAAGESATVGTLARKLNVDPRSVETADGGAIVVGQFRWVLSVDRTDEPGDLELSGIFDYLADDTSVTFQMQAVFDTTMAFHVPAADAEDSAIVPLGASDVLVEVRRDDGEDADDAAQG